MEKGDFSFLPGLEILKICPGFVPLPLDRIRASGSARQIPA